MKSVDCLVWLDPKGPFPGFGMLVLLGFLVCNSYNFYSLFVMPPRLAFLVVNS